MSFKYEKKNTDNEIKKKTFAKLQAKLYVCLVCLSNMTIIVKNKLSE